MKSFDYNNDNSKICSAYTMPNTKYFINISSIILHNDSTMQITIIIFILQAR